MQELEEFSTKSHSDEINSIYENTTEEIEDVVFENRDIKKDIKLLFRYLKKNLSAIIRDKLNKEFQEILYITVDTPPVSFINKLREQYPQKEIKVLVPILDDIDCYEKTNTSFNVFSRNKVFNVTLYKQAKNKHNIQIYGLYSKAFSEISDISEMSKLQNLAPFIKSARMCAKKLKPDIIHCENIPFFLGSEFENILPYPIKVIQSIKDFSIVEMNRIESFWAAINLADKYAIKKICKDSVIKNCILKLFNLHNTKKTYKIQDCLNFIYKNYFKFRKYLDKCDDIDENVIFNKLNSRILQMFPQMAYRDSQYYNPMVSSIKKCNLWITYSKPYYNELFENPKLSGSLFSLIKKTKEKSSYISVAVNSDNFSDKNTKIYQNFNSENFRKDRGLNKKTLIKEFSSDRIKTSFIDPTLFKSKDVKIFGNLDSFYEAPLLFADLNTDIFACGCDILFNTLFKMFELNKNIQIIFSIKNGYSYSYIKNRIDFLSENRSFNGRWVFIDGELNLSKFLASADIILLPNRTNTSSTIHLQAMHYGCIPVANRCGTLDEQIPDIFDDMANGCGFKTKENLISEIDACEMFCSPLMKALTIYQNNPSSWNLLVKNCLNNNFDWDFRKLERFDKIYNELI